MESNQLPKYGAHQNPQHRHLVIHAPKDYMVEKNRKLKEQFAAAAQAGSEGLDINSSLGMDKRKVVRIQMDSVIDWAQWI